MQDLNLDELRVAYGIDKDDRFISVHLVALNLGPLKSRVLLPFKALIGSDTTSSLYYKRQKNYLGHMANILISLSNALLHLSTFPLEIDGVYRGICSSHV